MRATLEEKTKLMRRLDENNFSWCLSTNLFGDTGCDIYDFEIYNYTYFLDNVRSIEDLLEGLKQLSPFVDDALAVAERMSYQDFVDFKLALAYEHRLAKENGNSKMPKKYMPLVVPKWFIPALHIAEKFEAPLGIALIRLVECEVDF